MMKRLLPLFAALALSGCKSFLSEGAEPDVTFSDQAAVDLKKGEEALAGSDFPTATRYFEFVKSRFAFHDAAVIAELRLADVQYAQEQWAEARDAYQTFVKIHPTHSQVDYAAFRNAESFWQEAPKDFFFFPPAFEKDEVSVKNAVQSLNEFLRQYPASKHTADAKKVLGEARSRLAQHEMFVAHFYAKRHRWAGAVGRLKTVLEKYPDLGFDEEALWQLHDAYQGLHDTQGAAGALKQIQVKFPNSKSAQKAARLLGS